MMWALTRGHYTPLFTLSYKSLIKADMYYTVSTLYTVPKIREKELCDQVPNSYIHVSVSDLYIPNIGLPIWLHLQQYRQTDPGNM